MSRTGVHEAPSSPAQRQGLSYTAPRGSYRNPSRQATCNFACSLAYLQAVVELASLHLIALRPTVNPITCERIFRESGSLEATSCGKQAWTTLDPELQALTWFKARQTRLPPLPAPAPRLKPKTWFGLHCKGDSGTLRRAQL